MRVKISVSVKTAGHEVVLLAEIVGDALTLAEMVPLVESVGNALTLLEIVPLTETVGNALTLLKVVPLMESVGNALTLVAVALKSPVVTGALVALKPANEVVKLASEKGVVETSEALLMRVALNSTLVGAAVVEPL